MTDYRTQPINQKNADFVEQVADRIEEMQLEGRSLWQDAKRRFFRNKAAVASLIILAFIIIFITVAPWFFPFTYEDTDWNMMSAAPTMEGYHFFGTDASGRDLLVRTAIGGRISLLVGIAGDSQLISIHVFRDFVGDAFWPKHFLNFYRNRGHCLAWSCTYRTRTNPQPKK